ncbi:MAG: lysozyme inhibitor LprI family protein [Terriglobia bacterium]
MSRARDLLREIVEVRGRRSSDLPTGELIMRLLELEAAFEKRADLPGQVLKYFPVALVALMESYFRLVVKELVDHGDPYLANAEPLFSGGKLDFRLLHALHGKRVSLGDVIAHTLPLSSLSHVNSHVSTLLGRDFLGELRTVTDRWAHEIERKPDVPILTDPDKTFAQVARTFELRHIICHEAATAFEVQPSDIEETFVGTSLFLKASRELITNILHPGAPLTQTEMNIEASNALKDTLSQLQSRQETIQARLPHDQVVAFNAANAAWKQAMEAWATFVAEMYKGGTIQPLIYANAADSMAKLRLQQLSAYSKHLSEEP